jgi:hypothetical protein
LGIAPQSRAGTVTDKIAIKVYVSKKLPKELLDDKNLIPSKIVCDGQEFIIDVEEAGIPKVTAFTAKQRPLVGGASVSPEPPISVVIPGTLGCCVTKDDGEMYILSCNHVLAHVNEYILGTPIIQPGILDGGIPTRNGNPNDGVAKLSQYVPIDFGTHTAIVNGVPKQVPNVNYVDCALAKVAGGFNNAKREIYYIGYPNTKIVTNLAMLLRLIQFSGYYVCKMGRTTEYTEGTTSDLFWEGYVDYGPLAGRRNDDHLLAYFMDQVKLKGDIGAFAAPGDSGSLVLDKETLRPFGLLFSVDVDKAFSYCNKIENVMTYIGIPRI